MSKHNPTLEPRTFTGMTAIQAALAAFGADQDARPWRASCRLCGSFHVVAVREGQARHLVREHLDQEHKVIEVWKAGEL